VRQQEIDLAVSIRGPNAPILDGFNASEFGLEVVYVVADPPGLYTVFMTAVDQNPARGSYRITISRSGHAVARDRLLMEAQRAFAAGLKEAAIETAEATESAVRFLTGAAALYSRAGDRRGHAQALGRLGVIHQLTGRYEAALGALHRALSLFESLRDGFGRAQTLREIALVHGHVMPRVTAMPALIQRHTEILDLFRALRDRRGEAITLNAIGSSYSQLGHARRGLDHRVSALQLWQRLGNPRQKARSLTAIAGAYSQLKRFDQALEFASRAHSLQIELHDLRGAASSLTTMAVAFTETGRLTEAVQHLEKGLALRRLLGDRSAEAAETHFLARIECLRGDLDDALTHARQALALIEGLRGEIAEPTRRAGLHASHYYDDLHLRILLELHGKRPAVGYDIEALLAFDRACGRFAAENERIGAPGVGDIQRELGTDSLLLEYWFGNEQGRLWALTAESVRSFPLPSRKEVQLLAGRAYSLLTTRNRRSSFPARLAAAAADRAFAAEAAHLSRMLLGPVADLIGDNRLVIVTNGAIQSLPFSALPDPRFVDGRTLLAGVEVVRVPSAAALPALRRARRGRARPPNPLAVIADPVFEADDPRLSADDSAAGLPRRTRRVSREILRAASAVGLSELRRLAFSRQEALGVAAAAPGESTLCLLDFDANVDRVRAPAIRDYRILHFATHGFVNPADPDLSGLVLSLVDTDGRPREGFLRFGEIGSLRLPADLVVLSACETAVGPEFAGEGTLSLSTGFFRAGASRVISSLWKIDDEATAELMRVFYQELLQGDRLPPAAALRAAQLHIAGQERWRAPYFWAGFVIQGDWQWP
jgi:CHAT domain-containing protein/tetratricopeptide (TPR) repeat protein